jgi:hypothetical protein
MEEEEDSIKHKEHSFNIGRINIFTKNSHIKSYSLTEDNKLP